MKLDEVLNQVFTDNDTRMYYYVQTFAKAKENINVAQEKEIYEIIVKMMMLSEEYKKTDNVFSSNISNISDDEIEKIKEIDINKFPIVVSSRISDVLWVRNKDIDYAQKAVEKYLELFQETVDPDHWIVCINYIFRATVIAAQIDKNGEAYKECINLVLEKLSDLDGKDKSFLSIQLIYLLEFQEYKDKAKLLNFVNKIIENAKISNNVNKVEQAYELKLKIEKNQNNKKIINLEWAEYYENLADEKEEENFQSISNKVHNLEEAIHKYNDAGEKSKSEVAMSKLEMARKNINKYMTMYSSPTVDISEIVNQIERDFQDLNFKDAIIMVSKYTKICSKENIKEDVIEESEKFISRSLFATKIIDGKGRTLFHLPPLDSEDIQNDSKTMELYMHRKLFEKQCFEGSVISSKMLNIIKDKYTFERDDINFLVKDNFIIPKGRERIFLEGIFLGLKGDYYASLHILAPQMENLFRNLAEEVGGITVTLEDDNTSNVKVLSSVFDIEKLNECYNEDVLFTFRSLLNERAGANIRNNIGHGIMEENIANSAIGKYFLAVTIKLLSWYMKNEE